MKHTSALVLLGASANAIINLKDIGQNLSPHIGYPGDNCCYLYEHISYGGDRVKVCHEDEKTDFYLSDLEDGDWNERVSSYYCGKNVWYNMCNTRSLCDYGNRNSGAGHHKNSDMNGVSGDSDFNDKASWMEMGPYDPSDVGAVTLFRFSKCHGRATRVYWDPNDIVGGQYTFDDLNEIGMLPEDISSVMVPKGYKLDMYSDNGLWNWFDWFDGEYVDDVTQEMKCFNLADYGIDNKLRSLTIKRDYSAVGSWQAITSTES